jgi:hypothetical protein
MQMGAWGWKHVELSVWIGACRWEHVNGSVETGMWWWEQYFSDNQLSRIIIFEDIQIFTLAWNERKGEWLFALLTGNKLHIFERMEAFGWEHAGRSMQAGACIWKHADWSYLLSKNDDIQFFSICM